MNTPKYTRNEYMNGTVTFREYYAQFVTPEIKQRVLSRFGIERLLQSTDEHLNDIPLRQWDALAGSGIAYNGSLIGRPSPRADDGSLASAVCTLKEAARQLIEENKTVAA